ncbi:hypothetical protein HMPREF9552_01181, partial [Escherichia coli MS 198-1]
KKKKKKKKKTPEIWGGLFLLFNKYKYILIMHPAAGHYFSISGYSKFCCFIREYLYDT